VAETFVGGVVEVNVRPFGVPPTSRLGLSSGLWGGGVSEVRSSRTPLAVIR
jgi:hypothetical protein